MIAEKNGLNEFGALGIPRLVPRLSKKCLKIVNIKFSDCVISSTVPLMVTIEVYLSRPAIATKLVFNAMTEILRVLAN